MSRRWRFGKELSSEKFRTTRAQSSPNLNLSSASLILSLALANDIDKIIHRNRFPACQVRQIVLTSSSEYSVTLNATYTLSGIKPFHPNLYQHLTRTRQDLDKIILAYLHLQIKSSLTTWRSDRYLQGICICVQRTATQQTKKQQVKKRKNQKK